MNEDKLFEVTVTQSIYLRAPKDIWPTFFPPEGPIIQYLTRPKGEGK